MSGMLTKIGVGLLLAIIFSFAYTALFTDVSTHTVPSQVQDLEESDSSFQVISQIQAQSNEINQTTTKMMETISKLGSPSLLEKSQALFGTPVVIFEYLVVGVKTAISNLGVVIYGVGGIFGVPSSIITVLVMIATFVIASYIIGKFIGGDM